MKRVDVFIAPKYGLINKCKHYLSLKLTATKWNLKSAALQQLSDDIAIINVYSYLAFDSLIRQVWQTTHIFSDER